MKTFYTLRAFAGNFKYVLKYWLGFYSILFCSIPDLQAQVVLTWDKAYGGNQDEILQYQQKTSDRGYIMAGISYSPESGNKLSKSKGSADYWVVKVDANGNKQWDKTFGGSGRDFLKSLQQTSDGGYILAGYSDSPVSGDKTMDSGGGFDYWIIKLDAAGKKQWDKSILGKLDDFLVSVQQTSDKGYILGGTSASPVDGRYRFWKTSASHGDKDYWVVKLDAAGNKQWDRSFGGSSFEFLQTVKQTRDKGYILGGYSYSPSSGSKTGASKGFADYWVVKLDVAGNLVWNKTIGGKKEDILQTIEQTKDEGFILGGTSTSSVGGNKTQSSKGESDYWLVKLDKDGGILWDKTLGGRKNDELQSVRQTIDGGYIVGGQSGSPVSGNKTEPSRGSGDFWIVKLNKFGQIWWDKTIGGNKQDELQSVQQVGRNEYMLGGYSKSEVGKDRTASSNGDFDFWMVKVKEDTTSSDISGGYTLTTSAQGEGSVFKSSSAEAFSSGSVVSITAKPEPGYRFAGWDGNAGGIQNPITITMNANKNIQAVFAPMERRMYEAEEAKLAGAIFKKENRGFSGDGYVDFTAENNGSINWKVEGKEGVSYDLTFHFANGTDKALPLRLLVNTVIVEESKVFPVTKNWGSWSSVKVRTVLKEGTNVIILKTTGKGGPNIDYLDVTTSVNGPGTMAPSLATTRLSFEQPVDSASMVKFKAFPNPFSSNVALTFSFAQDEVYSLHVYDISGFPIESFEPGNAKANEEVTVNWSPEALLPGIYIVKLVTSTGVQTFRIISDN